ncbi:hypothetical protein B0H19DRAFT_862146, partial [Mycena capillaripes]
MALPQDIPTLHHFRTKNFSRPDNVFCSPALLPAYISCTTAPEWKPESTDHFPIIQVLDVQHAVTDHQPVPMYRKTDWSDYRGALMKRLIHLNRCERYETVEEVERAIRELGEAIQATTDKIVPMSKPTPYMKRWYTEAMGELRRAYAKLERIAYEQR